MPRKKKETTPKKTVVHKTTTRNKSITPRTALVIPLVVVLVLSALVATAIPTKGPETASEVLSQTTDAITPKYLPVRNINFQEVGELSAKGVYMVDLETGEVLFSKNENTPLLPASTTKIATALVALKTYNLDDVLTFDSKSVTYGQTMGLKVGEKITVRNLLYGVLVQSANDAAQLLANSHPQGREAFILEMNRLVEELGLTKTHFTNPVGFDEYLHFSTAKDLVLLANQAMQQPTFAQIVATQNVDVASEDGRITHRLVSTNQLLGTVPGILGVKTGHTLTSGESVVTLVERDNHKVLVAVLGSEDRFGETEKLINWVFENFTWQSQTTEQTQ